MPMPSQPLTFLPIRLPPQEVVKFNQCKGVYVEQCDFAVATDNAIDAVAVQVGSASACSGLQLPLLA